MEMFKLLEYRTKVFLLFYIFLSITHRSFEPLIPNPHPRPGNKITSLVVDDYVSNQKLHKLFLEKLDVNVTVASDGKEALETYIKHGGEFFDFILMDVRMPIMDGFESAKKIRAWEKQGEKKMVDIYFVSGDYFNEEQVIGDMRTQGNIDDIGVVKCMQKPVDYAKLKSLTDKYKAI